MLCVSSCCLICYCQAEYNSLTVTELKAKVAEDKPRWQKKRKRCVETLAAKGMCTQLSTEDFELDEKVEMTDTTCEKNASGEALSILKTSSIKDIEMRRKERRCRF